MKTILFLDIDGVFSIPPVENERQARVRLPVGDNHHIVCWPIPKYREIIHAIGCDKRFHPVWLSAWGDAAHILTAHAMIKAFPVAYPTARRKTRHYAGVGVDKKLEAAVHYLRSRHFLHFERVAWLEDGFADETIAWAKENQVRLIDTTEEHVKSMLVANHEHAVEEFMNFLTQ